MGHHPAARPAVAVLSFAALQRNVGAAAIGRTAFVVVFLGILVAMAIAEDPGWYWPLVPGMAVGLLIPIPARNLMAERPERTAKVLQWSAVSLFSLPLIAGPVQSAGSAWPLAVVLAVVCAWQSAYVLFYADNRVYLPS